MSLFKARETGDFDREQNEVEFDIREFVRRDGANLRRQPESDGELVAGNIGSLLQRVSGTSVQEIDRLIGELQGLRDMLSHEGARVQQEVIDYATMTQAALHSTKIIAESLAQWKRVPDAPSISE
jgi:hypothetical protein